MSRDGFAPPSGPDRDATPGVLFRVALRAFPHRFRERHGGDLAALYDDYAAAGRSPRRVTALWDLLRNGFAARLDDLRPVDRPGSRSGAKQHNPWLPENRKNPMDSLWQDLRLAGRLLIKSPVFTSVAVISMAVGIGANTAVFGLVDAALLRPLAVPRPYELVVLGWRSPAGTEMPDVRLRGWYLRGDDGDGVGSSFSMPTYEEISARSDVLAATFAFADVGDVNLKHDDQSQLAGAQAVSGNYHAALGVEPALGRLLVADDDRAGAGAVVVLSHGYWRRRFGSDPGVIGETVRLNDTPFTIVGVTPPEFRGTLQVGDNPDITLPLAHYPSVATEMATEAPDWGAPGFWWLHIMGRLRAGVSMKAAAEQLGTLFHRSVQGDLFPDGVPEQYTLPDIELRPGFQGMTERRGQMENRLYIMAAVVGLVLLTACVNVANLSLARAGSRRREIAVRRSIGAGRARLIRQLLVESLTLSLLAGGLGVALAAWGREALVRAVSAGDPYIEGVRTDARVLAFGLLVSLLTGLLFGLVPALRTSRADLGPLLKGGAGDTGQRCGGPWGLRTLLVAQVAMSIVLLVVAGLFVRTLLNLEREATGFDARGVAILRVNPGLGGYFGPREVALYDDLRRRLAAIPGVQAATVASHSPVSDRIAYTMLKVSGYQPAEDESLGAFYNRVAPDFFTTFGIPVLAGRGIVAEDRDGAPMVAVVNQALAERYFAGESPIGRRIGLGRNGAPDEYEIVGVVADVKYQQLSDPDYPAAHISLAQHAGDSPMPPMTLALRTVGGAAQAIAAARRVVRDVDPDLPVFDARTLAAQQAATLETERLFARLALALGAMALGLACIGLYGVLAHVVTRRTREIGVRMALGAHTADVLRLIGRELLAVLVGVVVGLAAGRATTGLLESMMYELSPTDPLSYGVATAVLLAVAVLAAYVPARRASAVDPVIALRS